MRQAMRRWLLRRLLTRQQYAFIFLQQRVAESRAAINATNASLAGIAAKDFAPKVNVKMTSSVTVAEIERKLRERQS